MSLIEKLDEVAGLIAEGHWTGSGHAWRLIRDHGPAIRQAVIDAEKWRRWEPWLRKQNRVPFNLAKDLDARLASDSATGEGEGHD